MLYPQHRLEQVSRSCWRVPGQGQPVFIEARLHVGEPEDGQPRQKLKVAAQSMQFTRERKAHDSEGKNSYDDYHFNGITVHVLKQTTQRRWGRYIYIHCHRRSFLTGRDHICRPRPHIHTKQKINNHDARSLPTTTATYIHA